MLALLLGNAAFCRFLMGRFLALICDQILLFAVPLIIYRNTGSITQTGLVFFLEWLPRVVSLPLAGALADKIGGRVLFLISDFVRGTTCLLAIFLLLHYDQYSIYILGFLVMVNAFFQAQSLIAVETVVPRLFDQSRLTEVQSVLQTLMQLSMILGPILCGLLILVMEKYYLILVTSVVYLACALNTMTLSFGLDAKVKQAEQKVSFFEQLYKASSLIYRQSRLKRLTCESIAVNLLLGLMLGQASIIAISRFNVTDHTFSLLQLALGVASVLTLICSSQIFRRFDGITVFICSVWSIFIGSLIAAIATEFWMFTLGYALMISSLALFNVYMRAERVKLIPKDDLGKVIGIMVMFNQLPLPLAGVLIAAFSESVGPQNLLLLVILGNSLIYLSFYLLPKFKAARKVSTS
ncbi:MFS transporter [Aestuariibacter sp. AA17]|uniref:MFS transporter n=1 Tax=Fluctibacter corallii TaxID=2984329 RepID=A0ABT3A765_9ALTE|nr:MFS transporter [Aestuariibacter sp. AA17]MCV2884450.1 MFS transporter [Aestuariibacter sp. AA17]